MMPPVDSSSEFSALMSNLVEGGLTPSQFDQLAQILEADPAARAVYRDHLSVHAMLYWRWHQQTSEKHQESPRDRSSNTASDDWTAPQSDSELSSPLPGIDSPTSSFFGILSHAAHGTIGFFSQELPFALLIATLVTCLGLLAGSVVYVSHHKQLANNGSAAKPTLPPVRSNLDYVGRVTGMVDVQWSDDQTATVHGANVFLGRTFALASGLMEITYDTGAKVILQGPCTYKAESKAGGFLSVGKLTARIEQRGQTQPNLPSPGHRPAGLVGGRGAGGEGSKHFQNPASEINPKSQIAKSQISNPQSPIPTPSSLVPLHAPLFTIKTPTAVVTDLGTEFGVEVDKKGNTTSYVFRGSVQVCRNGTKVENGNQEVVLREHESVHVAKESNDRGLKLEIKRVTIDPKTFSRQMVKTLDLLDIVAGGNGLTNRREHGIDAATGMQDPMFISGNRHSPSPGYRRVTWHTLVDGVFTPNNKDGPVVVDSAEHIFKECPATCGGMYGPIWVRAAKIRAIDERREGDLWVYNMRHVEQFMPHGSGLLCMHSNAGITFDLEAIRKMYHGTQPTHFLATLGMADYHHFVKLLPNNPPNSKWQLADVWILVDGQLKWHRIHLCPNDGAVSVNIELAAKDRFLTLITTDAGNSRFADLVIFGDPILDLAQVRED